MEIKKKNEAESNPDISNDKPSSVKNETDKINELKRAVAYNLFYNQGTAPITATLNDYARSHGKMALVSLQRIAAKTS